ncbi:GNAT family N-acetyltransferase [Aestuariibius sp. 2305UL40-4]|uniref:GNAT family N-acetyltransferase n=1 Tax=Aestuariibius violaceus TaxID=3234132 RepID=UPI00345F059C
MIPTLTTERLTLRAPHLADFEAFADHCASPRATFEDGPLDRDAAWGEFAAAAGSWLLHGFGAWSIEDSVTGDYLGEVLIQQPPAFAEPELGWTLMAQAEGKGIASEAARAARNWAFATLNLPTLVSYISKDNTRSIALAERLGATRDATAPAPAKDDLVYRHEVPA